MDILRFLTCSDSFYIFANGIYPKLLNYYFINFTSFNYLQSFNPIIDFEHIILTLLLLALVKSLSEELEILTCKGSFL